MRIPFTSWEFTRDRAAPIGIPKELYDAVLLERNRFYLENLKLRANNQHRIDVIDPRMGDPVPTNEDERRVYVAKYSDAHRSFLEKKLYSLIGQVREMLDTPKTSEEFPLFTSRSEYDAYLRGTSNAFKLMLDFGEQMISEDAEYINRVKTNP